MQNFILNLGVQFSEEEKQKCLPTARKMVHLAMLMHSEGIVGLGEEVSSKDTYSTFMKLGAEFILDCVEPEMMEKIFQHAILSGGFSGADLLERLLVAEGFLVMAPNTFCMPNGEYAMTFNSYHTASAVAHVLGAMIGEEYIAELDALTKESIDVEKNINSYTSPLKESEPFEKRLLELTNDELVNFLMPMDAYLLAIALKGCSKSFIYHMKNGFSEASFLNVCKSFSYPINEPTFKDDVLHHQNIIIKSLETSRENEARMYTAIVSKEE